jgi:hypothetical protein
MILHRTQVLKYEYRLINRIIVDIQSPFFENFLAKGKVSIIPTARTSFSYLTAQRSNISLRLLYKLYTPPVRNIHLQTINTYRPMC